MEIICSESRVLISHEYIKYSSAVQVGAYSLLLEGAIGFFHPSALPHVLGKLHADGFGLKISTMLEPGDGCNTTQKSQEVDAENAFDGDGHLLAEGVRFALELALKPDRYKIGS